MLKKQIYSYLERKGWVKLSVLGSVVKLPNGCKMKDVIKSDPAFEIKQDEHNLPMVRLKKNTMETERQQTDLFEYVYFTPKMVEKILEAILPENWGETKGKRLFPPVLANYLKNTYRKCCEEDKVFYDKKEDVHLFNTGLVEKKHYRPIYLLLEKCKKEGNFPYYCKEPIIAGTGEGGKRITRIFEKLPECACYFDKLEDIYYDPLKELLIDWEHLIEENWKRFPKGFLEKILEVDKITEQTIKNLDDAKKRGIKMNMDKHIEIVKAKLKWNYTIAKPMYFFREKKMMMMLPLCLMEEDKADLVLVVEKVKAGYQAHTMLTIERAYSNARLVMKPETNWLSIAIV